MDSPAETACSAIALTPMVQQLEVRKEGDDWTGVTSTVERRKLQNRLNKRASSKINPCHQSLNMFAHMKGYREA